VLLLENNEGSQSTQLSILFLLPAHLSPSIYWVYPASFVIWCTINFGNARNALQHITLPRLQVCWHTTTAQFLTKATNQKNMPKVQVSSSVASRSVM